MERPKMKELERLQRTIDSFGGYCRRPVVEPHQFFDMQNMTADHFPVLAPRGRRGIPEPHLTPEPQALCGRDTLFSIRGTTTGSYLYCGDRVICRDGSAVRTEDLTTAYRLDPVGLRAEVHFDGQNICLVLPMMGDIDGDGRVMAGDALLALQAAMGKITLTPGEAWTADVDGDGRVTMLDALLILQAAAGKIELTPEQTWSDAMAQNINMLLAMEGLTEDDRALITKTVEDITNDPNLRKYMFDVELPEKGLEAASKEVTIRYNNKDYPVKDQNEDQVTYAGLPTRARLQFDGEKFILLGGWQRERTLVSMGSYIVIFPDKVAYNTLFCDDKVADEQKQGLTAWVDLENRTEVTSKDTSVTITPCRLTDSGAVDITMTSSAIPPTDKTDGMYWMDTVNHVLKQYAAATEQWASVPTAYVKIQGEAIGAGFQKYDGVTIAGTAIPALNGDTVLWDVGTDEQGGGYIVVAGLVESATVLEKDAVLTVTRRVPDMDYVVELNNRLWGCSSSRNEIYGSKLGDPTNWNCFMGLASDSYAATIGTPGGFTGAAAVGGGVLFFKENVIHRVYGTKPANFQITTLHAPGIQEGCAASAALVDETLYYKGVQGVYVTTGDMPTRISEDLGDERYDEAVGGRWGRRYVVSMRGGPAGTGGFHVFVYDPRAGLWHRQDRTRFLCCAAVGDDLYYAAAVGNGYALFSMDGSLGYAPETSILPNARLEEPVAWYVETGDIEGNTPENLTVAQVRLRMSLSPKSRVRVFLRYDDDAVWQEVWASAAASRRVMTLPLIPRRCGRFRMRIEGVGDCRIYAITTIMEQGSELRGCL